MERGFERERFETALGHHKDKGNVYPPESDMGIRSRRSCYRAGSGRLNDMVTSLSLLQLICSYSEGGVSTASSICSFVLTPAAAMAR